MEISRYTFLFDSNNKEFYIYNSLSNALIELDETSYRYLDSAKKNHTTIRQSDLDKTLYDVLTNKKFITDNNVDDFLLYKSIITRQRANDNSMHLTIAPTMDCCFRCHYCFEKYKEPGVMSEIVMDSIVKYLNSLPSKPDVSITWFGGEPLMAIEQIEKLYNKIESNYKKPNKSNIITTGIHINKDVITILRKVGITSMQITLDGLKETHNKVKYTQECKDAFSKVLDNVDLVMSQAPEINVVFRINTTKLNMNEYVPLYTQLVNRYKQYQNYGISPGIVMERGACQIKGADKSIFFTPKENAHFNLDLYHKHHIYTAFMRYPSRFFLECGMRNNLTIAFDPSGYAYKCWELIGNKKYAIGKLTDDGKLEIINSVHYNRQMYGADPLEDPVCRKCKYLPICNGGCPIQRIENCFENKKNNVCTLYKGYMEEFLKIHMEIKRLKNSKK